MAVVAVDTARLDLLAVDQHHTASDTKIAEANKQANVLVARRNKQAVQMGRFVAPKQGGIHLKLKCALAVCCVTFLDGNGAAVGRFQTPRGAKISACRERDFSACLGKIVGK